jgi:hypothetical protein
MAAFVPSQIEAGDGYDPRLIGFPLNILFAGITDDGQQSVVSVCYEPARKRSKRIQSRKNVLFHEAKERLFHSRDLREEQRQMADEEIQGQKADPDGVRLDI